MSKERRKGWAVFSEVGENTVLHYLSNFAEVLNAGKSAVEDLRGWIIRDVEVFKAGTWRGIPYTADDLAGMVQHFDTLKKDGRLDPVFKVNHSEDVRDQVGWILSVRQDGDLLLADIHLTEWEAYDKITSGTWKKVSAEIYLPELAEAEFGIKAHVLRAVAVVSIPQVKDLKGIVLNAERWADKKPKEGGKKSMWKELLAKMLGKTVDQLTEQELADGVAMFGEYSTENPPKTEATPPAAGGITITASEFVALSEKFVQLDTKSKTLENEIATLKKGSKAATLEKRIAAFTEAGKVLPAERESVMAFAEQLEGAALDSYLDTLDKRPKVVTFGETSKGGQGADDEDGEIEAKIKAYNEQFGQRTY